MILSTESFMIPQILVRKNEQLTTENKNKIKWFKSKNSKLYLHVLYVRRNFQLRCFLVENLSEVSMQKICVLNSDRANNNRLTQAECVCPFYCSTRELWVAKTLVLWLRHHSIRMIDVPGQLTCAPDIFGLTLRDCTVRGCVARSRC